MAITPIGPSKALGSLGIYTYGVNPVSVGLPNGKIAVAWSQNLVVPADGFTDTDGAIFTRLFNADGSPSGGAKLVNSTTDGAQGLPEITVLEDGGYVVSWVSNAPLGQGHNDTDVHAQIFNKNGSTRGKEIIISRDDPHTQTGGANSDDDNFHGNVIATKDGGFIATWTDGGPVQGAFAQRYDANGARAGKAVEITENGFIFMPGVAELKNGNVVVVNDALYPLNLWISGSKLDNSPTGISTNGGGRYEATLSDNNSGADNPKVAALENGGFAVAYKEYPSTGDHHLRVEVFDATAKLVKAVSIDEVNGFDGVRNDVDILGLSNGGFIVSWAVDEGESADGIGIRAQAFNGDGTYSGKAKFLNSNSASNQAYADLAETADGKVWVSYNDYAAVGTIDLLQGRLFEVTADGGKVPGPNVIKGNSKGNTLSGTAAQDDIRAKGGNDVVKAKAGNDIVDGGNGKDRLYGDKGNDQLFGGKGKDKLDGGKGKDVLEGGAGNDILIGGAKADRFIFRDGTGDDVIRDFNPNQDSLNFKVSSKVKTTDTNDGALLEWDTGSVLLQGVLADDIA